MPVDGSWKVMIRSPIGVFETRLVIKSQGDTFTGTQSGQGQSTEITDGKLAGDQISWSAEISTPMKMRLEYAGVLTETEMSGKVKAGGMGSFSFSGVRES